MKKKILIFVSLIITLPGILWGNGIQMLGPRGNFDWRTYSNLDEKVWSGKIEIKFIDNLNPVLKRYSIVVSDGNYINLEKSLPSGSLLKVISSFDMNQQWLKSLKVQGEANINSYLADLTTYFSIYLNKDLVDLPSILLYLNSLPFIEIAYPVADSLLIPPPHDIPPTTSDYTDHQGYLLAAPDGLDVLFARNFAGGRGEEIRVGDIEYVWDTEHEDLDSCVDGLIRIGELYSGIYVDSYRDHGTAVLGMLFGGENGYGITGMIPSSTCKYAPAWTEDYYEDHPRAILAASDSGVDVILLELQVPGPNYDSYENVDNGLVPAEWNASTYDAIRTVVANGIVVVEAAGNGYEDLDDYTYDDRFDRTQYDSGAIIVGAGYSPAVTDTRAPEYFTNWGSRVDVQAWGDNVYTSGYGDLYDTDDIHQYYTAEFAGTSSASPMIAGAVTLLLAINKANNNTELTPADIRQILVETGTPQTDDGTKHIGPLPDLAKAIAKILCGNNNIDQEAQEECDDGNTISNDGCDEDCKSESESECGNNNIEEGEECDDGNTKDGDGCSANCRSDETCGNSIVDSTVDEVCDDGNTEDGDGCSANCRSDETCGNSVVDEVAQEECDDGNTISNDGCDENCKSESECGNSVVEIGEICDDGNTEDGDGCSANCKSDESCGNSIIDSAAQEVCDDGNTINGDGCDEDCKSEAECGNNAVETGEICDDGNTENGDGCSADCKSNETCGNSVVDSDETCDDGNKINGDGCDKYCNLELSSESCSCRISNNNKKLPIIYSLFVIILFGYVISKLY